MAGNVYEWCLNKYEQPDTGDAVRLDGEERGLRVIRGGSWSAGRVFLRASFRHEGIAGVRINYIGFRIVQDVE